jgi:DNA replicative helicase MCM subunit Mcm2 (Cdc46/Mcm family)
MTKIRKWISIDKELYERAKENSISITHFVNIELPKYLELIERKPKEKTPKIKTKFTESIEAYKIEFLKTDEERNKQIIDIIQKLCDTSGDGNAARSDIANEAKIEGIPIIKIESTLDRLKRNGQIYEPNNGIYRVAE